MNPYTTGLFGNILVQANIPLTESFDSRGDETRQNRGSMLLNLGERTAESVWSIMLQQAAQVGSAGILYAPLTQNSNSVIGSVLNSVGIELNFLPSNATYPAFANLLSVVLPSARHIGYNLVGSLENDLIGSGFGEDTLEGGAGDDTFILTDDGARDIIIVGEGNDIVRGGDTNDRLVVRVAGLYLMPEQAGLIVGRGLGDSEGPAPYPCLADLGWLPIIFGGITLRPKRHSQNISRSRFSTSMMREYGKEENP